MGERRARLALVVKYYPPLERISGIIGYVTALARALAPRFDLHVVTFVRGGAAGTSTHPDAYEVHRVGAPFPVRAGRAARALRPDATLVISGINDLRLAVPYVATLNAALGRAGTRLFYQATNVGRGSPAALARVLRAYRAVLCAGGDIHAAIAPHVSRALLVEPGVDVAALGAVPPASKTGRLRYGFVNHFTAVKGADLAVRAFAELAKEWDDVEFLAAGTGELEAALFAEGGSTAIRGFLPDGERLALMRSCDVMLLPFRTGVSVLGVSQTVLECMALGVVVVGSDTPAIAPAITHGVDGFLFRSPPQMRSLLEMLRTDDDLRARVGRAAAERARERYDVARAAGQIAALVPEAGL